MDPKWRHTLLFNMNTHIIMMLIYTFETLCSYYLLTNPQFIIIVVKRIESNREIKILLRLTKVLVGKNTTKNSKNYVYKKVSYKNESINLF